MKTKPSITETPNFLSADIDLASPREMLRILRQTDSQIFSGYKAFPGLLDEENLDRLIELAKLASEILSHPKGCVVLSGAGTSGRLAMFGAREFNRQLKRKGAPAFRYLMAGGDSALIQAQEGAEDDPVMAVEDLNRVTADSEKVFYVGITCGFSAPYIAGQLDYLAGKPDAIAVLMGFNSLELARTTPIEGWNKTFAEAANRLAESDNGYLLNPIVGPEPVTGSTRMKSGTATKILMEVLFATTLLLMQEKNPTRPKIRKTVIDMLLAFEQAYRTVYFESEAIANLIHLGGNALSHGKHIYYLGATANTPTKGRNPDVGILALVDASECPPTFGAEYQDVRGFLVDGWRAMQPDVKDDFSFMGESYRISIEDFRKDKLHKLTQGDLCVFLGDVPDRDTLIPDVQTRGACTAAIIFEGGKAGANALTVDQVVRVEVPRHKSLGEAPLEMAVKLVLNALTTGAHIMAGKVYGNRMVDLRISNNKLFRRTVGIIVDLMGVTQEEATEALLRAVFETDCVTEAQREAPISEYVEQSKKVNKVVPKALLMASGRYNYAQASEALATNPVVRAAVAQFAK